ncbi:uncharacterized protein LOC124140759 [Haliotis rufescens]|uniref:uncharacterized protein LOC124140759 n=1 Tax=Haliotis rufescens TaxID=6454 RepID=UPI001EB00491|nr:uncharacterized protein LOC124140759 [Haliotis rufescens]
MKRLGGLLFTLLAIMAVASARVLSKMEAALLKLDISSQVICLEYERKPTNNCAWVAGLNIFADQLIDGGKIIAYKIQWKSRRWSTWYVPGINDISRTYNPSDHDCDTLALKANSMRRMWSLFYDHTHVYIICKP